MILLRAIFFAASFSCVLFCIFLAVTALLLLVAAQAFFAIGELLEPYWRNQRNEHRNQKLR